MVASSASAELFSGPYVGFDIGHDNLQVQDVSAGFYKYESGSFTEEYTFDNNDGKDGANGISGSLYAGYDMRIGSKFFAGVEGRASLSNATHEDYYFDTEFDRDTSWTQEYTYETMYKTKVKESFALSARAGYLLNDKTGIYVRGGLTYANMSYSDVYEYKYLEEGQLVRENLDAKTGSDKSVGYTIGAGLETALSDKFSLRAEYNMARYNDAWRGVNDLYEQDALDNGAITSSYRSDVALYSARIGISYRF